ncbi:MAG: SDR family oxidoreductase [Phycisphaerae bacterium]|nr:SDR family oxidoreductase [Phycisphaerae bacterium]MDW8262144.1 SDR family oxidoreductase [Phycisphaerales bacterium]
MPEDRRTALVTGGSKRVGRQIVLTLARAGFDVAFTTRQPSICDLPGDLSTTVTPITLDVCELPQAADALLESVQNSFGRLDVLVHNASIYEAADLADTSLRMIRKLNRIHVEVPILLTRAFAPLLRGSRGHVILMLDAGTDRPAPRYLAYHASKAAMANLTLSLARALAPEVTVNGIAPGVVEWPENFPPDARQQYLSRLPLARAGEPADVANLVKFLVTEGRYITGQILRVDGGRSIV